MKISLHMNGRIISFSPKEFLSKIKIFENLKNEVLDEETYMEKPYETARKPTDGKCFIVQPNNINIKLFEKERNNFMQEWVRRAIIDALAEVTKYPEKYGKKFATFVPLKTWKSMTVNELRDFATVKGSHIANWVEQALEWGQRLTNGETWKEVCNLPDSLNWYRLVIWKNNHAKIIGGCHKCKDSLSATTVFGNTSNSDEILHFTVPLIVVYL